MKLTGRAALLSLLAAPLAACTANSPGATDSAAVTDSTTNPLPPTTDSSSSSEATSTDSTHGSESAGTTTPDPTEAAPTTTDATTTTTTTDATTTTTTTDSTTTTTTSETTETTGNGLWDSPNLWYSVDDALMYIEIDPADGSVVQLVHNQLVSDVPLFHGQNGLTMLEDGSLLGSRESAEGTQIYHVPNPPTTPDTPAEALFLGMVPTDGMAPLRIEALYTDCEGRVYLMDTGKDVGSADGNRLLRFTGSYLQGDLAFDVITDLENASVADIDDMSPGLVNGEVSDSIGFAMDSGVLWQIDYTTGTGMQLATTNGTWGIHVLGGPLFDDKQPRLYILSSGDTMTPAALMEVDLNDYSSSRPLVVGPNLNLQTGYNGWSGLAGPLTECMTTIPG